MSCDASALELPREHAYQCARASALTTMPSHWRSCARPCLRLPCYSSASLPAGTRLRSTCRRRATVACASSFMLSRDAPARVLPLPSAVCRYMTLPSPSDHHSSTRMYIQVPRPCQGLMCGMRVFRSISRAREHVLALDFVHLFLTSGTGRSRVMNIGTGTGTGTGKPEQRTRTWMNHSTDSQPARQTDNDYLRGHVLPAHHVP